MDNKYIIIITGDLAAGKTSYGKKISEILSIPFYSKDEIKEVLYDSYNNDNIDYESKKKIGANSYSVFYYIIEQQMKVGLPIITESNFSKESIPFIENLLNKYNYKSITLRFTGDLKVLHERFIKREYSKERHSGLASNGVFDDYDNFYKASLKGKEFKLDNEEIVIDTTDFSKVDLEDIINKIREI
jgi:deoxyadenosine/deoxycytidine kinase